MAFARRAQLVLLRSVTVPHAAHAIRGLFSHLQSSQTVRRVRWALSRLCRRQWNVSRVHQVIPAAGRQDLWYAVHVTLAKKRLTTVQRGVLFASVAFTVKRKALARALSVGEVRAPRSRV